MACGKDKGVCYPQDTICRINPDLGNTTLIGDYSQSGAKTEFFNKGCCWFKK